MSGASLPMVFFCLATGAALGCLFLLCKVLRILLHAGKLCTAALDLLYCCFCAAAVFLCALAVDRGRLRVFQVVLQLAGGWAAVAALDPFVSSAARGIRFLFCKVLAFFRKRTAFLAGHFHRKRPAEKKRKGKRGRKAKKAKKKT